MSLARQFFREFRPLFRMLEEPLGRAGAVGPVYSRHSSSPFTLLSDPFFASANVPEIDLSEETDAFKVEASVPGVKRENLELRIGDNGQSLTIRGKTVVSNVKENGEGNEVSSSETQTSTTLPSTTTAEGSSEHTVTKLPESESRALSTERTFTSTSSFSRTIWFPQRVDESGVSAKLADGVLTIRVPKAEEKGSFKVNIE